MQLSNVFAENEKGGFANSPPKILGDTTPSNFQVTYRFPTAAG
jgi:hypothetical protein